MKTRHLLEVTLDYDDILEAVERYARDTASDGLLGRVRIDQHFLINLRGALEPLARTKTPPQMVLVFAAHDSDPCTCAHALAEHAFDQCQVEGCECGW